MKNNSLCNSVFNAAQNCTGYPFVGHREKHNNNRNKTQPNKDKKSNDKKNKNQGINVPKGQNATTLASTEAPVISSQPNKAQKARANLGQNSPKPTTGSGAATHKSESKNGALGEKGPGFRP